VSAEPRHVVLVRLSSVGDVVHGLPVAAALRARWPRCRLTWLAERREGVLLRGHPAIDTVIEIDTRGWRRRGPAGLGAGVAAVLALRRRARASGVDVAIDLQGLLKSAVLVAASGARRRIGFARRFCREPLSALFTNRRVTPPADARHVVEQNLALLEPLGIDAPEVRFTLPVDAAAETKLAAFFAAAGLEPRGRVALLVPGAARPEKRWPPERFAALARALRPERIAVVVVWGPGEEPVARAIAEDGGARLAPPTDLLELLALLRRAGVVVGGDTGPLHLAAAMNTPVVGLYGPTNPRRNGPYGQFDRCVSTFDTTKSMDSIHSDDVIAMIEKVLAS
jgi:lipopolysaccharide heptosyltransferase I